MGLEGRTRNSRPAWQQDTPPTNLAPVLPRRGAFPSPVVVDLALHLKADLIAERGRLPRCGRRVHDELAGGHPVRVAAVEEGLSRDRAAFRRLARDEERHQVALV